MMSSHQKSAIAYLDDIVDICNACSIPEHDEHTDLSKLTIPTRSIPTQLSDKIQLFLVRDTILNRTINVNFQELADLTYSGGRLPSQSSKERVLSALVDAVAQLIESSHEKDSLHTLFNAQERELKRQEIDISTYLIELAKKDAQISEFTSTSETNSKAALSHAESRIERLENELAAASKKKEVLERQVDTYQHQFEQLSNKFRESLLANATLLPTQELLDSELGAYEATIDRQQSVIEDLNSNIRTLQEMLRQYEGNSKLVNEWTTSKGSGSEKSSVIMTDEDYDIDNDHDDNSSSHDDSLQTTIDKQQNKIDELQVKVNKLTEYESIIKKQQTRIMELQATTNLRTGTESAALKPSNENVESKRQTSSEDTPLSPALSSSHHKIQESLEHHPIQTDSIKNSDNNIKISTPLNKKGIDKNGNKSVNFEDDDDGVDDDDEDDENQILYETVDALRRRVAELEMWLEIERAKNSPAKQVKLRQLLIRDNTISPMNTAREESSPHADGVTTVSHGFDNSENGNSKVTPLKILTPADAAVYTPPSSATNTTTTTTAAAENLSTERDEEKEELRKENSLLIERSIELYDKVQELQKIIDNLKQTKSLSPRLALDDLTYSPTGSEMNQFNSQYYLTNGVNHIVRSTYTQSPLFKHARIISPLMSPTRTWSLDNDSHCFVTTAGADIPLIYIEIGSFYSRVGLWNHETQQLDITFVCRTCQAVPAISTKDRYDIVRHAAMGPSDPMYQEFREKGYFIGANALYCCFDHPDRALRGSLKLSPIVNECTILDMKAFTGLLEHCLERGASQPDGESIQLIFTYKLGYTQSVLESITRCLFEELRCANVCLLSESTLLFNSLSHTKVSAILVDIGAFTTSVVPIYEGMLIQRAANSTALGGEHITGYLTALLYAQQNETFNGMLPRRSKEIARMIKENCSYVAESFESECERYGDVEFQSVQLINLGTKSREIADVVESEQDSVVNSSSKSAANGHIGNKSPSARKILDATDIRMSIECDLLDGTTLSMTADVERFHCTEVLFRPDLSDECRNINSLVDVILKSVLQLDECIQTELCCNVILGGGSSLIPGLADRLTKELRHVFTNEFMMLPSAGLKVHTHNTFNQPTNDKSNSALSSVSTGQTIQLKAASVDRAGKGVNLNAFSANSSGASARIRATQKYHALKLANPKASPSATSSMAATPVQANNFILSQDYEECGPIEVVRNVTSF